MLEFRLDLGGVELVRFGISLTTNPESKGGYLV